MEVKGKCCVRYSSYEKTEKRCGSICMAGEEGRGKLGFKCEITFSRYVGTGMERLAVKAQRKVVLGRGAV